MSNLNYLNGVLHKYRVNVDEAKKSVTSILPIITKWGGEYIVKSVYSGSLAKGTAVNIGTDADVFISLSSTTKETLSEIYKSLGQAFTDAGYEIRKQNVSIRVSVRGYKIDLVPGKRHSSNGNYHSLYKRKTNSWTQTDIHKHINHVKSSNRLNEIKLAKVWTKIHDLEFPSFYLELAVIDALRNHQYDDIVTNFLKVLEFFQDELLKKKYLDPSNTNNIISDDLTYTQKRSISNSAYDSLAKSTWSEILW